ncbi:MAG: zf-HC2 domain-containing protein [Deltaproteobacteria bacterium]|nr:MAG: zf-HC2 domain-containing protein [Deltaproteobacteria bacterium]
MAFVRGNRRLPGARAGHREVASSQSAPGSSGKNQSGIFCGREEGRRIMDCREIRELFSDYLDGRLVPAQVASLEEHLRGCRDCKQEMESLRTTISLIGSLGGIEPSADFLNQVQRKIDKQGKPMGIWAWLFEPIRIKVSLELTALILLSIGALHLYYRSPELSREAGVPAPSERFQVTREKPGKEPPGEEGQQTTKGARPVAKPEPQPSMPKSSELSKETSQGRAAPRERSGCQEAGHDSAC